MLEGCREYDADIHFHSVSYSTDPEDFGTSVYFTNIEDTKDFADRKNSTHRAVWMWERGDCCGYKDVWICYWWSNLLAKDYKYGTTEGRGRGWIMDESVPARVRNDSIQPYLPLDPRT